MWKKIKINKSVVPNQEKANLLKSNLNFSLDNVELDQKLGKR